MIPAVVKLAAWTLGQVARRRPRIAPPPDVRGWLTDSRNAVLLVLAAAFFVGGGRKLLLALKARGMLDELNEAEPSEASFVEATRHGRAAVMDLFRLLTSSTSAATRDAAGRALSVLWKSDELIAEEEKAIVSRGFVASWKARKRYPRTLASPIPIEVQFGVPFLEEGGDGVSPKDLEWSYRLLGTDRMSLESFSPWGVGPPSARFEINPRDFPGNGPHRLALQARVRTTDATTGGVGDPMLDDVGRAKKGGARPSLSGWELELPSIPFSFEFDPNLSVDSLFTFPDSARGEGFAGRLVLSPEPLADAPRFALLNREWAIRDLPALKIRTPLPSDLAHAVHLELEGCPSLLPAGALVISGQGELQLPGDASIVHPLSLQPDLDPQALESIGERRVRAVLSPDANLGWANPDVRSIWPETLTTDWIAVRIIRS